MTIVPLTHGATAMIDDEDADMVGHFKWQLKKDRRNFYARAYVPKSGDKEMKKIYLHALVMRIPDSKIDHINGNGLDCQKHNLRKATGSQNAMNQRTRSDNKTGFRGVVLLTDVERVKPYRATLYVKQKVVYREWFKTAIEAAKAYNVASLKFFGEYGRRNLIPSE